MISPAKFLKNPLVKRWWFVGLLAAGGGVAAYLVYKRGKAIKESGAQNGAGVPPAQITSYGPGYGPPALPGGNGEPALQVTNGAAVAPPPAPAVDPLAAYPFGTPDQRKWMYDNSISPVEAWKCWKEVNYYIEYGKYISGSGPFGFKTRITSDAMLLLVAKNFGPTCELLIRNNMLTYAIARSAPPAQPSAA